MNWARLDPSSTLSRRLGVTGTAVATISAATAVGQLIVLAVAPALSRLFSPQVFAPFAIANALALSMATVAALRLDQAITLPQDDDEATGVASAALRVVSLATALAFLVICVIRTPLATVLGGGDELAGVLLWAPAIAGLMGSYLVLSQLAIRHRMYGAIARRNVLQAAATALFQLLAGVFHFGAQGLAAGLALGQLIGVVLLARGMKATGGPIMKSSSWRSALSRYRRFPLILAPSGAMNALGIHSPILIASSLLGAQAAGLLGMAQRVLLIPVALLGMATSQVFLGEFTAARRTRSGDLAATFLRATRRLGVVGLAVAAMLLAGAPAAFTIFLGSRWSGAGTYAQLLAVAVSIQMVASPLSQTIIVMGRIWWQVSWDAGRLIFVSGCMFGAFHVWGEPEPVVAALGVSSALSYGVLWLLGWLAVRESAPASTP